MPDDSPATPASRWARWEPLALFLACVTLYWLGNDRTSLWDRDEPRYAETAREMLARGDFVVPYFNDTFRFQKPVLSYWLIALAYRLFGETEFAARAFMGLSVAGAAVVVWKLGDRMFGRPAGRIAAWMFALSPISLMMGKLALPDGPQLFASTCCFACLYFAWRPAATPNPGSPPEWIPLAFWVSLAAAVLAKGPIVPGMILLTLVVLAITTRSGPRDFRLRWGVGLVVFLLLAAPWMAGIYYAVGPAFFRESVGNQIARRIVESFDEKFNPPGYYAATLLFGFAPWFAYLTLAAARELRAWRTPGPVAFLVAWIVGPMILLECFRSKQPHYYAPAYPALALLAGGHLARLLRGEASWRWDFVGRGCVAWVAGLGIATTLGLAFVSWRAPVGNLWPAFAAGVAAVGVAASSKMMLRKRWAAALAATGVAQAAIVLCATLGFLPAMESIRIVRPMVARWNEEADRPGQTTIAYNSLEPSMVFYARRPLAELSEAVEIWTKRRGAGRDLVCFLTDEDYQKLGREFARRARIEASWSGWLRMHWDTVHMVRLGQEFDVAGRAGDAAR